jgi:uncharacterized protein YuzE
MQIRYFQDTDTIHITFKQKIDIVETKELDENILIDVDKNGSLISMTIEHARQTVNIDNFSFQQIASKDAA